MARQLTNEFVEDLRSVHDLRLLPVQHFANLAGDQGFAGARRPKQEHALHVADAEPLHLAAHRYGH